MIVWKDVPGVPGYQASSEGLVRRVLPGKGAHLLVPKRGSPSANGYLTVGVVCDGKRRTRSVHKLVCAAFHGGAPSILHWVAHGDGDRQNNAPTNLRWALPAENSADMVIHGTKPIGDTHGSRKLSKVEVDVIRGEYAAMRQGKGNRSGALDQLARRFGVKKGTIKAVVYQSNWKGTGSLAGVNIFQDTKASFR